MSIPNLLAIARLILTPVAMALILAGADNQATRVAATIVFVIAALTDFADGYLARRWQLTSTLGAFLDTVADKILVAGALLALVEIDAGSGGQGLQFGLNLLQPGIRSLVGGVRRVVSRFLPGCIRVVRFP